MLAKLRLAILGENADGVTTAIDVGPDLLRRAIFEVELEGVEQVHHLHGDVAAVAVTEDELDDMLGSADSIDAIKAGAAEVALSRFGHDVSLMLIAHGITEEGITYPVCLQLLEEALNRTPKAVASVPLPKVHVHEDEFAAQALPASALAPAALATPDPAAPQAPAPTPTQTAAAGIDETAKA